MAAPSLIGWKDDLVGMHAIGSKERSCLGWHFGQYKELENIIVRQDRHVFGYDIIIAPVNYYCDHSIMKFIEKQFSRVLQTLPIYCVLNQ